MKALIIILTVILITLSILNSYSQNTSGNSSIIYHDYIPDLLLDKYTDTLKIDINQDSILDIEFYFSNTSSGGYFYTLSLNKNCQYTFFYFTSNYSTDSLTSDSLHWRTDRLEWIDYFYHEKLGIKFTFNDLCYYGWLHGIQSWVGGANGKNTLTIDKYAFCTIANYPLLWGQTEITNGITEFENNENTKAIVTDNGNSIVVQSDKIIKNIKLLNISGVALKTWDKVQSKKITLSISGIPHGTYLVQVALTGNKIYTEKILF